MQRGLFHINREFKEKLMARMPEVCKCGYMKRAAFEIQKKKDS